MAIEVHEDLEDLKRQAAHRAVDEFVHSNMVVGLGTGSTSRYAIDRLGERVKSGELVNILGIPTSERSAEQAQRLGIPLTTLDSHPVIDVAIDGADEVDDHLNLVKGRGGALLREKMVAVNARTFVVIVDKSKMVSGLGVAGAMPVEVIPFCHHNTLTRILALDSVKGCRAKLRSNAQGDGPYITDNHNYIVDLYFDQAMKNPFQVADDLSRVVGVVETGLFLGMSSVCIIAGDNGVELKERPPRSCLPQM